MIARPNHVLLSTHVPIHVAMLLLLPLQEFTPGVGNWVADEVLYQARLHPEQTVGAMGPGQVEALHAALKHVVQVGGWVGGRGEMEDAKTRYTLMTPVYLYCTIPDILHFSTVALWCDAIA